MTSPTIYDSPEQSPMVSHPDVADPSLSIRRPASISSRASHSSRRHRHGRSHHGGSSYQPQNEFPFFAHTGDVEIIIAADGQEKRYLLHRLILAQCSGFFEAGTSEQWSRAQAQREMQETTASSQEMGLARIGEEQHEGSSAGSIITVGSLAGRPPPRMRWRYELDWDNTEEDEEPMLAQKSPSSSSLFGGGDFVAPLPPPSRSKPPVAQSAGFFRSMANLTLGPAASTIHLPDTATHHPAPLPELVRDYDNLFRIFYNHPPSLDATNIASAYSECKALLSLADMYDALPVIGPRIDHHLLRFSSRLFKQIAKYPPSYLKLGYLARSRVIFGEALIHVVGQWPAAQPHLRNAGYGLPDCVLELVEDKADELDEIKSKIEAKLFRLSLTTSRGERVNPNNAYLDWLAVSLFRQWVAENTTPPPQSILKHPPNQGQGPSAIVGDSTASRSAPPRPPPPAVTTGRIYRLLGSSDTQAYLAHDELKRFLKCHPGDGLYSRDTLRRFERKMDEIKNLAREIVKPLMRNFLELDLRTDSGGGLPYLTCTRVEDSDLPWD